MPAATRSLAAHQLMTTDKICLGSQFKEDSQVCEHTEEARGIGSPETGVIGSWELEADVSAFSLGTILPASTWPFYSG